MSPPSERLAKLRVIVRRDLPVGLQAAQAVHGALAYAAEHPESTCAWMASSNTVALLTAADERGLARVADKARRRGLRTATFREPDLADSLTAVVVEPDERARSFTGHLPLLGS